MSVRLYEQNFHISCKRYFAGDYVVLCKSLSVYDWSSLYNEMSVNAAVNRLNVALTLALSSAVLSGNIIKHKYSIWFSGKLNFTLKNNCFCRCYRKRFF
jgi:hypothetical protein